MLLQFFLVQLGTEGDHTVVENNVLSTSFIFFSADGKEVYVSSPFNLVLV